MNYLSNYLQNIFFVHKRNSSLRCFFYAPKTYNYYENDDDDIILVFLYFYVYLPIIQTTDNSN